MTDPDLPEPLAELTTEQMDRLATGVLTGAPPVLVALLACRTCGVLLWDVASRYRHAHPEVQL